MVPIPSFLHQNFMYIFIRNNKRAGSRELSSFSKGLDFMVSVVILVVFLYFLAFDIYHQLLFIVFQLFYSCGCYCSFLVCSALRSLIVAMFSSMSLLSFHKYFDLLRLSLGSSINIRFAYTLPSPDSHLSEFTRCAAVVVEVLKLVSCTICVN